MARGIIIQLFKLFNVYHVKQVAPNAPEHAVARGIIITLVIYYFSIIGIRLPRVTLNNESTSDRQKIGTRLLSTGW